MDDGKSYVLSVALAIGDVLLMSNYDDICPKVIHTSLAGLLLLTVKCLCSTCIKYDQRLLQLAEFCSVSQNFEKSWKAEMLRNVLECCLICICVLLYDIHFHNNNNYAIHSPNVCSVIATFWGHIWLHSWKIRDTLIL